MITTKELLENAIKARSENRLTAQQPGGLCYYKQEIGGKQYGCAVGVSFSPELLETVETHNLNARGVRNLIADGIVEFDDNCFAEDLQSHHDQWARANHKFREHQHHQSMTASFSDRLLQELESLADEAKKNFDNFLDGHANANGVSL